MLFHSTWPLMVLVILLVQATLIMGALRTHQAHPRKLERKKVSPWSDWFRSFDQESTPSSSTPTSPPPQTTKPTSAPPKASSPLPAPVTNKPSTSPKQSTLPTNNSSPTLPASSAKPSSNSPSSDVGKCSVIRVRKEWRKLSREEQIDYISAVKCLAKKPSKLIPGGIYRRYDDFENVHSRMRSKIHWIACFLPWHRYFMFLWEKALREECDYKGSLPRWDWTLDSDDMTQAPIWSDDPQTGFGTNGQDFTKDPVGLGGGAVEDGAFANLQLYYPEQHNLERNYNLPTSYEQDGRTWGSQFFDQKAMSQIQSQPNYAAFAVGLEGVDPNKEVSNHAGPHAIIHVIIGGDISPTAYAANEPLFYLHHANVDYHWWKWQSAKDSRLREYSGITTRGSSVRNAKLTDILGFLKLAQDPTVADVMDTTAYPYCYKYE